MNFKEYQEKALRTESRPDQINFGTVGLHAVLSLAIQASLMANEVKRAIFYNKPIDNEKFLPIVAGILRIGRFVGAHADSGSISDSNDINIFLADGKLPERLETLNLDDVNIRLLHASLGMFTESAEMLEALVAQLEGKPLDMVNFSEEVGDTEWYKAIAVDELGADLGKIRQTNIAKLAKRYPGKFDADAAVNRDLDAERVILEAVRPLTRLETATANYKAKVASGELKSVDDTDSLRSLIPS